MTSPALELIAPSKVREGFAALSNTPASTEVERIRQSIAATLTAEPFNPSLLIAGLKQIPRIEFLFEQDSRIVERYTIEEHTAMVLRQFERYVAQDSLPATFSRAAMRLALALHDIGKPLPEKKSDQHIATAEVIDTIRTFLPFGDATVAVLKSLVTNDPLGKLVVSNITTQATMEARIAIAQRGRSEQLGYSEIAPFAAQASIKPLAPEQTPAVAAVANEFRIRAASLGLPAHDLFCLHRALYGSDVAAYTHDAVTPAGRRASPGLEFLFELNPEFDLRRSQHSSELLDGPRMSAVVRGYLDAVEQQLLQ